MKDEEGGFGQAECPFIDSNIPNSIGSEPLRSISNFLTLKHLLANCASVQLHFPTRASSVESVIVVFSVKGTPARLDASYKEPSAVVPVFID
jgi:hypothetical protein